MTNQVQSDTESTSELTIPEFLSTPTTTEYPLLPNLLAKKAYPESSIRSLVRNLENEMITNEQENELKKSNNKPKNAQKKQKKAYETPKETNEKALEPKKKK